MYTYRLTSSASLCSFYFHHCVNVLEVYEFNNVCENEGEGCLEE